MKLSVVIPCYNEEESIAPFCAAFDQSFADFPDSCEMIFVNDGSFDATQEKLAEAAKQNRRIRVLSFSRNFGKEAAILAGLTAAGGEYVAVIDADLQQDPAYLRQMCEILDNNPAVDIVAAYQEKRKEKPLLNFIKSMFYKIINLVSEIKLGENSSDFRMLRRKAVSAILAMPEKNRFSKGIFS